MKRTVAYIDGYNLFYGLLKGTSYKWLDPTRLVSALLRDDHELVSVKYFTSPVKTYALSRLSSLKRSARM